ncbi:uncharacterized protein LOC107644651 isoform X6 [Arachis ipaensis]|uniref:uncharacterized protein LOC107644651 isoform X6 n=1 Tax=Arachis ipaensis TaxID=130454 RepID=UPI0007AFDC1A|nr:uncharacterized protein LOC107644651 isoform X6 [Arachis ipaensis]XP_025656531.1 uncharacterized protein LOC112751569 isoform X6 [Arachis hypogaea]QHO13994.1 uncharacterized protein DS421_15g520290 [Arachis hypogaea]
MAGREVREYTNLSDPKDKKWGKGKDKIDDEDITFQRMVAKMQEVAGERGGYLHGRGALDSDDLLYLKEQMEAEEDAERLLRRTEKRAFAAFKRAASLADSSPASVPLAFRVEPKPKSGIRQQDLLKKVVEIKPKRPRTDGNQSPASSNVSVTNRKPEHHNENERPSSGLKKVEEQSLSGLQKVEERPSSASCKAEEKPKNANTAGGGLLGLAYASSDDDDEE